MSLPSDSGRRKRVWGAVVGATLYGGLAAILIVIGARAGGEGRVSAMLALMLSGLPMTLVGLAFDGATLPDLLVLAIIGDIQWTVVGALLGRWLDRRAIAKRSRGSSEDLRGRHPSEMR